MKIDKKEIVNWLYWAEYNAHNTSYGTAVRQQGFAIMQKCAYPLSYEDQGRGCLLMKNIFPL